MWMDLNCCCNDDGCATTYSNGDAVDEWRTFGAAKDTNE